MRLGQAGMEREPPRRRLTHDRVGEGSAHANLFAGVAVSVDELEGHSPGGEDFSVEAGIVEV